MSFEALLAQRASHRRRTATLFALTLPATASGLTFTSAQPARLKLNADGLAGDATVEVAGTLSGSPQTETVTVPAVGAQVKLTTKRWSTITQVACAAAAGALRGAAVADTGQELLQEVELSSSLRCRLRPRRMAQVLEEAGNLLREEWKCYLAASSDVRLDDLLVIDAVTYEVHNIYPVYGGSSRHHLEADVHRV